MSVISQAVSQQSILSKNARKLIKSFVNKRYTQQSKMLLPSSITAFSPNIKDLKELIILLLLLNLILSSLC
jgi:hypothetical protein